MNDSPLAAHVSQFEPVLPPIARPPRDQLLGQFVPSAVRRYPPVAKPLRPVRLVWTSILTLGILPLIQLRDRLHRMCTLQHQQIELAAELIAKHVPTEDAKIVADAASAARPSKGLAGTSGVGMIAAAACAFVVLQQGGWTLATAKDLLFFPPTTNHPFALAWLALLTAGYGLCWMQLNQHIGKLQQFALAFNAVAAERTAPVAPPPAVIGLRPMYLAFAVGMMLFWMLWALPMMLAWGALRSFVTIGDRSFRTELADRLTKLSGVRPVVGAGDFCGNPQCRAPAPADARYCPRCGKSARLD